MADKKISELVSLTGANAATGDLLPIVDVSATETKKITRQELFSSVPSLTTTGNVTIGGDLTVNGTTTTINTQTLDVEDKNITIAFGAADAAAADGAGLTVDGANATLTYVSAGDNWAFNKGLTAPSATLTTVDINGGSIDGTAINTSTIDGTVIGGSSAAAITGTTITGTSFVSSGDMTFGDNDKAIFGAGSDLQIYHSGTQSIINDGGTGDLLVQANTFKLQNAAGTATALDYDPATGALQLYKSNDLKLATTTTGIDVTGTVTANGLTIQGNYATFSRTSGIDVLVGDNTTNAGYIGTSTAHNFYLFSNGSKSLQLDTNGDISFYEDTGTTAKFVWDASAEALGIGTSSPDSVLHLFGNTGAANVPRIKIEANGWSNDCRIERSAGADGFYITNNYDTSASVADNSGAGTSGLQLARGFAALHTGSSGNFTERMRIDSSGNLLVGTTNTIPAVSNDTDGIALQANGTVQFSANATTTAIINRKATDGNILQFRKDGTTVGSIGANGGRVYTAGPSYGAKFGNVSLDPCTSTGSTADNAYDLGGSSVRWKDLYLSGGVYLGGTGAANLLDDYETGTWTPVVEGTTVTGTGTYSGRYGRYTKIGNLVTVFGHYDLTAHTGSGNLKISGLPFTAANVSQLFTIGQWSTNNLTYDASAIQAYVFSSFNTTNLNVSQLRNGSGNLPVVLDSTHIAWFSISYYV